MTEQSRAFKELKWIRKGLEDARQWRDWDEVARLRGRISHVMALLQADASEELDRD